MPVQHVHTCTCSLGSYQIILPVRLMQYCINVAVLWSIQEMRTIVYYSLPQESNYFTPQGEFRVDAGGSQTLLHCLMYKLAYHRFGDVQVCGTHTGVIFCPTSLKSNSHNKHVNVCVCSTLLVTSNVKTHSLKSKLTGSAQHLYVFTLPPSRIPP